MRPLGELFGKRTKIGVFEVPDGTRFCAKRNDPLGLAHTLQLVEKFPGGNAERLLARNHPISGLGQRSGS